MRALDTVAPGTALREGIDNIVHSRTGGLILIGSRSGLFFCLGRRSCLRFGGCFFCRCLGGRGLGFFLG